MKSKIFVVLVAFAFIAGTIGYTSAEEKTTNRSTELATLLPESDMVMTLDADRFMNQALPQILSANPSMLTKINGEVKKIKDQTGLDVREFRQVAVGIRSTQISAVETDFEPVILARGTITAKTLVSVAKVASKGKYKTEKVDGRTIYIFSPKEFIDETKGKVSGGNTLFDKMLGSMSKTLSKDIAMVAYDSNTIAFGMPSRVRETVGNTARISNDVLGLLNRKPNSIINVGAKVPVGLSKFLPLDDDELGKDLDSIRQMQGSMNVVDNKTMISILAKSQRVEQAESLEGTLLGFRLVFSKLLKGMKGNDKQVYGRTLQNMEISREADEIIIDLNIPQSDINVIIGKK